MTSIPRSAAVLTWVSAAGASAASLAILLWADTFPKPETTSGPNLVLAEARGWSAATLLVAVPMVLFALHRARQGSLRARLVWLGALFYLVYSYLEFAVSPPFSALFLLYVVTFSSALAALVAGMFSLDLQETARAFAGRPPRLWLAGFAFAVGGLLALAWLKGIVGAQLAGEFGWPKGEAAVRHVVYALDLGLQVPLALAAGVLTLRRRAGGYLLSSIFLINAVCMGTALFAMVLTASWAQRASLLASLPFALLTAVAVLLSVSFFRAVASEGEPRTGHAQQPT